jgi:hypothetical protein
MGALLGGPIIPPVLMGPEMENTEINLEKKESSAVWDSNKGTSSEAPCGAAE